MLMKRRSSIDLWRTPAHMHFLFRFFVCVCVFFVVIKVEGNGGEKSGDRKRARGIFKSNHSGIPENKIRHELLKYAHIFSTSLSK